MTPAPGAILAEQPTATDICLGDGMFAKSILVAAANTMLPQHSHAWDHISVIAAGSVAVWEGDEGYPCTRLVGVYAAPASLKIAAGVKHTFVTQTADTVIICLHRIDRTGEIDIAEEHQFA